MPGADGLVKYPHRPRVRRERGVVMAASTIVEVTSPERGLVAFTVEHFPTTSYSRSVGPAARKALKFDGVTHMLRAGWTGRGSIYEQPWEFDLEAPAGRCRTRITYRFDTTDLPAQPASDQPLASASQNERRAS